MLAQQGLHKSAELVLGVCPKRPYIRSCWKSACNPWKTAAKLRNHASSTSSAVWLAAQEAAVADTVAQLRRLRPNDADFRILVYTVA